MTKNRRPNGTATQETIAAVEPTVPHPSVAAPADAIARIRARRRAEAWQAGRELGILLGLEELLHATTAIEWAGIAAIHGEEVDVWREFAWGMAEREWAGRLLAGVGAR